MERYASSRFELALISLKGELNVSHNIKAGILIQRTDNGFRVYQSGEFRGFFSTSDEAQRYANWLGDEVGLRLLPIRCSGDGRIGEGASSEISRHLGSGPASR